MRLLKLIGVITLGGCSTFGMHSTQAPPTPSDSTGRSYGYIPLDPLPVLPAWRDTIGTLNSQYCFSRQELIDALPDETMRIAIGTFDAGGNVHFGTASAGIQNQRYVVIVDYMKFQTLALPVRVDYSASDTAKVASITVDSSSASNWVVPTYVGVGLRLTANISVLKDTVNLGSLIAIGAAAQSNRVSGTLVVQTLGITGPSISPLIPLPSDISAASIANAIAALGAIKTKIYDSTTDFTLSVVGVYNTIPGGQRVTDAIVALLLQRPLLLAVNNSYKVYTGCG